MKKIEALIRSNKVSDVRAALDKIGIPGVMISEIDCRIKQKGIEQQLCGETYKLESLPEARIEVVVSDGEVNNIVNTIQEAAFTGKLGDGKIFIYVLEDAVRINALEQGEIAV